MYSLRASSPMYMTIGLPATAGAGQAPSWLKRPRALRLAGVEVGLKGSISTTQPKVLAMLR